MRAGESLKIPQIQGRSWLSPYEGKQVTTTGVVTAVQRAGSDPGFFLQDLEGDGDPQTSDGIFVSSAALRDGDTAARIVPGQVVTVSGQVREQHTLTSIAAPSGGIRLPDAAATQPLPEPARLALPESATEAARYLEAREGMFGSVENAMVTGPTNNYGDFWVVDSDREGTARQSDADEAGAALAIGTTLINTRPQFRSGDRPGPVVGPVTYRYGDYSLLQTAPADHVEHGPAAPGMWGDIDGDRVIGERDFAAIRTRLEEPARGPSDPADLNADGRITRADLGRAKRRAERITGEPLVTFGTLNMWNLFDTVDDPGGDSVPSGSEYTRKLTKIAETIRAELGAPDVLAVQEVENARVLEDLVARPELEGLGYQFAIIPGVDPRGINVGFLHRDNVKVTDLRQAQATSRISDGHTIKDQYGREVLFTRPPLLADVTVKRDGKTEDLTFIVNHLKSKFSPNGLPTEPRRVEQAKFVGTLVDELRRSRPNREVMVLGDLNDHSSSKAVRTLTGSGADRRLSNSITELAPPAEAYSYNYKGTTELIDHILVTSGLLDRAEVAGVRHLNADAPASAAWDSDAAGSSDHDSPYLSFRLPTAAQDAVAGAAMVEGKAGVPGLDEVLSRVPGVLGEQAADQAE